MSGRADPGNGHTSAVQTELFRARNLIEASKCFSAHLYNDVIHRATARDLLSVSLSVCLSVVRHTGEKRVVTYLLHDCERSL